MISDELTEKVCNMLRMGAYVETAVVVAGISKEVFYHWCKIANGKVKKPPTPKRPEGRAYSDAEREPYKKFLHAIELAMEEATARDLSAIETAINPLRHAVLLKDENGNQLFDKDGLPLYTRPMQPDWKAAAWRLQCRRPKDWGKHDRNELPVGDSGPQVVVYIPSNGREAKEEDTE